MSEQKTLMVSESRAHELRDMMLDGKPFILDGRSWWVDRVFRDESGMWKVVLSAANGDVDGT